MKRHEDFWNPKGKRNPVYTNGRKKYFNYFGDNMTYELIRAAYASVANIVVIPMQEFWIG